MKSAIRHAIGQAIQNEIQTRVRRGSIKAVKTYITLIKNIRLATMGVSGLGILSSVLVSGLVLVLIGLISLIPVAAENFPIALLLVGAVLSILAAGTMFIIFSEKRWLEYSKAYEMMDGVMGPWTGLVPPLPFTKKAPAHAGAMQDVARVEMDEDIYALSMEPPETPSGPFANPATEAAAAARADLRAADLKNDAKKAAYSPASSSQIEMNPTFAR
jgi:hypothetical protein